MGKISGAEVDGVEREKKRQRVARLADEMRGGVERRGDGAIDGKGRRVLVNSVEPNPHVPCAIRDGPALAANLSEHVAGHSSYPRGCFSNQFHAERMIVSGSLYFASQPSSFFA